MKIALVDILKFKVAGIYCLINEDKKMVQVFGSRNVLDGFNNVLRKIDCGEYKTVTDDISQVYFSILETTNDEEKIKPLLSKWIEYFKRENYTFFKDSNLVKYVVKDGLCEIAGQYRYSIYLENKRKDKIIVGVFKTKEEALVWKNIAYPSGIISDLIYADNEDTEKLRNIK